MRAPSVRASAPPPRVHGVHVRVHAVGVHVVQLRQQERVGPRDPRGRPQRGARDALALARARHQHPRGRLAAPGGGGVGDGAPFRRPAREAGVAPLARQHLRLREPRPAQRVGEREVARAQPLLPLAPGAGEGHPERPPRRRVQAVGEQRPADRAHELPHPLRAVAHREVVDEERAVHVARGPSGPGGRRPARPVDGKELVLQDGGAQRHVVDGAAHPSRRRQPGLHVRRQPLRDPPRHGRRGEEQRRAPQHPPQRAPDPPRVVQVEGVRQLVGDDQLQPVVVERQGGLVHRRVRVDHHPVGGKGRGVAVGVVHVVADHQVHPAGGRPHQRGRELRVRRLRPVPRPPRERVQPLGVVHAEVGRVEGPPARVRRQLRPERRRREREGGEEAEGAGKEGHEKEKCESAKVRECESGTAAPPAVQFRRSPFPQYPSNPLRRETAGQFRLAHSGGGRLAGSLARLPEPA